jgi:hypothetical protein
MVMDPEKMEPGKNIEMGQLFPVPQPIDGKRRIYQFHIRHTHVDTRFGEIKYTISHDDGRTWEGPNGSGSLYDLSTPTYELSPNSDGWHLMAPGLLMDT